MKKFKNQKEILINNEFKVLAFQLLKEEEDKNDVYTHTDDFVIEARIDNFIERKLKHCKNQGV